MQAQVQQLKATAQGGEQQALTHRAAALEMVRLGQENALLAERLQEVQLDAQVRLAQWQAQQVWPCWSKQQLLLHLTVLMQTCTAGLDHNRQHAWHKMHLNLHVQCAPFCG